MSQHKDPNQGEGDRVSARRYDGHVREFVAEGQVPEAAKQAEQFVERDPEAAARAERAGKRGPVGEGGVAGEGFSSRRSRGPRAGRSSTVDELVAKGHSIVERVQRVVDRVRARLSRDREAK